MSRPPMRTWRCTRPTCGHTITARGVVGTPTCTCGRGLRPQDMVEVDDEGAT